MRESTFSFWEDDQFNVLPEVGWTGEEVRPFYGLGSLLEVWRIKALSKSQSCLEIDVFQMASSKEAILVMAHTTTSKSEEQKPTRLVLDSWQVETGPPAGLGTIINGIWFDDAGYHLLANDGERRIELLLRPLLPGWKPGSGKMCFGDLGEKWLYWSVPVPRGLISVSLDNVMNHDRFEGIGYLDHLASNFGLSETLSSLWTAQMLTDEYTVWLFHSRGNHVYSWNEKHAIMIAGQGRVLASTPNVELVATTTRQGSHSSLRSMVAKVDVAPGYRLVANDLLQTAQVPLFNDKQSTWVSTNLAGSFKLTVFAQPAFEVHGYGSVDIIKPKPT